MQNQYTEEHYAQLYNDLPEGLKDLVLSGRLAILVSAIGSRHGLNADQVADLEPAIEDVCLGLITTDELVENILKNVNVDQRVANRLAGDAELEILKPFTAELVIARKQKEDLDRKIQQESGGKKTSTVVNTTPVKTDQKINNGPKDVSEHSTTKKVADFYEKGDNSVGVSTPKGPVKSTFDWDSDFGKTKEVQQVVETKVAESFEPKNIPNTIETKLDVLTESINKLVNTRFGPSQKDDTLSPQMQELMSRLERAEKENEENKRLIRSLQNNKPPIPVENIFGKADSQDKTQNKIQIDKERKVEIDKKDIITNSTNQSKGNIQVTSVSKSIPVEKKDTQETSQSSIIKEVPIISSSVSRDTLDSITETRNKPTPVSVQTETLTSEKKAFSLDELLTKADDKIKDGLKTTAKPATLTFPGVNDDKKIDIKNLNQKDAIRQTLLDDLEFIKNGMKSSDPESQESDKSDSNPPTQPVTPEEIIQPKADTTVQSDSTPKKTLPTSVEPFKDELIPKTKEERMKALQDKIKALNKGVSVGGKTNIAASGLDPYKI